MDRDSVDRSMVTGGRIDPGRIHSSGEPLEQAHYADAYTLVTDIGASPREWLVACFEEGIPRRDRDVIFRRLAGFATLPDRTPGHVAGWKLIHDDESAAELAATGPRMTGRLRLNHVHGGVRLTTTMRYNSWLGRIIWSVLSAFHRRQVPHVLRAGSRLLWD